MPEEVNVQTNNNTSLVAKSGELDNKANLLYFRKDVVLNDPQMTLTCDNLVMKLSPVTNGNKSSRQLELADAVGNVKLVSKKNTANNNVKDNASVASVTTLTSKKAKLEYLNNILTFTDNVKISDAKGSLACNILTLYLKDKVETKTAKTKNTAKSNVFATGVASKGKSLDKAIALGNVFMNDGASELKTNKLTMIFDQLKPGQKGLPGMFQAGDVRLVKVYCDGNVLAKTTSSKSLMDGFGGKREKANQTKVATPRTIKAQHAITNLVTGIQEFHKDVLVTDSQATLACQEVYIYTRPEANPTKAKKIVRKKTVIEEMDEDPFAIVSEDSIPATISLGNGMELEKIICKKDIVIEQKSKDNRNVKVFGQLGSYIVKDKKTIISGTSKKKPSIIMDGRYQECKQLVYHMEDERFEIVDGGPITKISNK
jgi:lipopolysaccharide export system protein LptA